MGKRHPGSSHGAARSRRHAELGAANSTFVLVFPVLLVMVMGLIQWGLWLHAQQLVDAAAQDGGQIARDATGTVEDGRMVAEQLLADATGSGLLRDVTVVVRDDAGIVEAVVSGRVQAIVPLPGLSLTVEGRSVGAREQFVAQDDR